MSATLPRNTTTVLRQFYALTKPRAARNTGLCPSPAPKHSARPKGKRGATACKKALGLVSNTVGPV